MRSYVADFETTTTEPTRVWAWGVTVIGRKRVDYDVHIETFFEWIESELRLDKHLEIYFHNLKFDAGFLLDYLFTHGFTYSKEKTDRTFSCLIDKMNTFYSITVIYKKRGKNFTKVTFLDSKKKLPFSVERLAKAFKLPILKGKINYEKEREIGYQLTDNEKDYLKNDVQIVSYALNSQFEKGLKKMTIGADALHNFKATLPKYKFKELYPVFSVDADSYMRQAYKGGYTYLKEGYSDKDLGSGLIFDVNSLYPYVLHSRLLPHGVAIPFQGKYEKNIFCPLYMQEIRATFKLKEGYLPTIQLKDGGPHSTVDYIKDTGIKPLSLFLTSVDLELFFEHYDVESIEYHGGFMFQGNTGVFTEYVEYWMSVKEAHSETKNALYQIAKLMLNSLYGKFGKNPVKVNKIPFMNDDGIVKYAIDNTEPDKPGKPIYTPLAAFVTSYARDITIRTAQQNYDRFIYADTDSLHILGDKMPDIDIHPSRLGAWDHEKTFTRARYLKPKLYAIEVKGKMLVKGAGMTDDIKIQVSWNRFHLGERFYGKKTMRTVRGGNLLKTGEFSIH
jgi:hypothetical protein